MATQRECSSPNSLLVPRRTKKGSRWSPVCCRTEAPYNLMPAWQGRCLGSVSPSGLSLGAVFIDEEGTWQGQGKCFPLPGGPSGRIGYLYCLNLPDYHLVLPSSPLPLCRLCLCETKRKNCFLTNARSANFSLHMCICSLGALCSWQGECQFDRENCPCPIILGTSAATFHFTWKTSLTD